MYNLTLLKGGTIVMGNLGPVISGYNLPLEDYLLEVVRGEVRLTQYGKYAFERMIEDEISFLNEGSLDDTHYRDLMSPKKSYILWVNAYMTELSRQELKKQLSNHIKDFDSIDNFLSTTSTIPAFDKEVCIRNNLYYINGQYSEYSKFHFVDNGAGLIIDEEKIRLDIREEVEAIVKLTILEMAEVFRNRANTLFRYLKDNTYPDKRPQYCSNLLSTLMTQYSQISTTVSNFIIRFNERNGQRLTPKERVYVALAKLLDIFYRSCVNYACCHEKLTILEITHILNELDGIFKLLNSEKEVQIGDYFQACLFLDYFLGVTLRYGYDKRKASDVESINKKQQFFIRT